MDERCFHLPEGTQPGANVRLSGQGMPVRGRPGRRGDLYLVVEVEIPTGLDEGRKEILRRFAASG